MSPHAEPVANGLRFLYERALAAGGQSVDGVVQLPPAIGTGYIKLVAPEPGLRLAIHHCSFREKIILKRELNTDEPEKLLISCFAYDPPADNLVRNLSSVQITSSDIAFSTTLPAQTTLFIVGVSIEKSLIRAWLGPADQPLPTMLTSRYPVVVETRLIPEIGRILADLALVGSGPYLPAFFYKIRIQELLYWLFVELADRTTSSRFLHADDVEKIYQARAIMLASLSTPPSLLKLAQAVGLSEPKLKVLFRQIFGTSPYAFYQVARLDEARRLLQHVSVAEVGHQLGFTNLSHFARLFAKQYQLTPKKYQAMHHP